MNTFCGRSFLILLVATIRLVVSDDIHSDEVPVELESCKAEGSCSAIAAAADADEKQVGDDECFDIIDDCEGIFGNAYDGGIREACVDFDAPTKEKCRKTCHMCGNSPAAELIHNIYSEWPQVMKGSLEDRDAVWQLSLRVDDYMFNTVYNPDNHDQYQSVKTSCLNRDERCLFWASIGECEANPNYMQIQCAPSCLSCHLVSFETRCPFDSEAPTAWKAGDLNVMFERIINDPMIQLKYKPKVYSKPATQSVIQVDGNDDIRDGPWVIHLENFLSEEECKTLIDLGTELGYQRSKDVGEKLFDGTYAGAESTGRTSSNAWCLDKCWTDPTTQQIHKRMEDLIQIPAANYEYLQLLKYEVGQFYEQHHDYIVHDMNRSQGVRILTVFLYLNDVEDGGGTKFPILNHTTIYPKRGRALIWPSVKDGDPNKKDRRTEHEALPVLAGVKYGANAWVHQRDFKDAYSRGCQ